MRIKHYRRPGGRKRIVSGVVEVARSVSGSWFTKDVCEYIGDDLKYQDLIALFEKGRMIGFISYTCLDGKIAMTLMAIDSAKRNRGYGTKLYERFEKRVRAEGFGTILVQTVPEEVNQNYKSTLEFYRKMGFVVTKRYTELWEHGAVELEKDI